MPTVARSGEMAGLKHAQGGVTEEYLIRVGAAEMRVLRLIKGVTTYKEGLTAKRGHKS